MFKKIFNPAKTNWESRNKFMVSNENVEKVVNPPQNPTPKNSFKFCEINSLSSNPNIKNPSRKLPKILTNNVPNGKNNGKNFAA